jgi:hypothetical protein
MDVEPASPETSAPGKPARLRWRSLSDGFIVSFVIMGPTLLAGLVLRDQRQSAWKILLVLAGLGIFLGGAIAGRYRRRSTGALAQGVTLGVMTATAVLVANLVRVLVAGTSISGTTLVLWVGIEVGSVVIAAVGALVGRSLYLRSRKRKVLPK